MCLFVFLWGSEGSKLSLCRLCSEITPPSLSLSKKYFSSSFCLQPVPTSPTSTSPTPGGTLGMSKMDAPSMQDVYILSPVSGLYSTRSDSRAHRCLMMIVTVIIMMRLMCGADDSDDSSSALISLQGWTGSDVVWRDQQIQCELPVCLQRFRGCQLLPRPGQRSVLLSFRGRRTTGAWLRQGTQHGRPPAGQDPHSR